MTGPIMAERTVAPPLEPGTHFVDKYLIRQKLGGGGMGQVFEAVQEPIDRTVAIKVLHPKYVADEHVQKRFLQEAQAASQLSHPNTITIYDFGQTGEDLYFIVMEYVEGKSLAELLDEHGPLPLEDVIPLVIQVAQSLGEAHRKGIIHRDLKPDNIMVVPSHSGPARIKVLDFGIAKLVDHSAGLTQTGAVFGTPGYMAPEQARGKDVAPSADFYALSCCLYELLTGELPYMGQSLVEIMMKHQEGDVPTLGDGFPPSLDLFLRRALSEDPEDRPQSADDYVAALLGGFADDTADGFSFQEPGTASSGMMFPAEATGGHSAPTNIDTDREDMPAPDSEAPSDGGNQQDIQDEFRAFSEKFDTTGDAPDDSTGASESNEREPDENAGASTEIWDPDSGDAETDSGNGPTATDEPAQSDPSAPSDESDKSDPSVQSDPSDGSDGSSWLWPGLAAAGAMLIGGIAIGSYATGSNDEESAAAPTAAEDNRTTLTVTSQPDGAVVSLDGRRVGVTPIDLQVPRDQPITLQIDKKGYETVRREELDPTAVAQKRVFADLAEQTLELKVTSPVPRAALTIDGESYGRLPADQSRTLRLDWPDSPLTLEIDAPGYETYVTKIPTAALEPTLQIAPTRSDLVPQAALPDGDTG
jgi:serine/threonine-protein kinase